MFPVRVVDGIVEVDVTVPEPAPASADIGGASVVAVDVGGSAEAMPVAEARVSTIGETGWWLPGGR